MPEYDKVNEKDAPDWAATVDDNCITRDHILKAYRLHLKSCSVKSNPCKRNCSNNPKCISGLGENRLFNNKEGTSINLEDEERREPGSFAGLKNLGATCYVNSQLQVWYHNPFLREAIYKWKPEDDEKEISAQLNRAVSLTDITTGAQFSPVSPVGQLQLIFARLQFSARRYVDPTQFVNSLQLDVSQQQDAQEFSKLFLTLLEDDLSSQKDSKVKNIVQTQYCGEYEYVTRCSNCGTESFSPSKFYELSLNIRGHKDIHQCLDEFFSPEILEGSNQYYCNICESKQNVIRTIRLRKCPPYLNLQLLRFIYDRQKNCRRKLNSSINFPLTMDMKKYFQESVSVDCTEYNLVAVLVHKGQSAHSGHYIAHIKDRETGDWYKFNDEFVEKTQGKVIKLCTDNLKESTTTTTTSSSSSSSSPLKSSAAFLPLGEIKPSALNVATPFTSAPTLSSLSSSSSSPTIPTTPTINKSTKKESTKFSKGSYMLVYKSAVLDDKKLPSDSSVQWDIPEYLQQIVVEENSIFEDHLEIKRKERDQRLALNREKQEEMFSIFKKLIITDNEEPFEWINKNWLKDWLHSDFESPIPPLDNSNALCPHNKLSLKAAHAMKCVNSEGASILFNLYSGQPRLIDALCRQCVQLKVNPIQTQIPSMPKLNLPLDPVNNEFPTVNDYKEPLKCIHQRLLYPPTLGDLNLSETKKIDETSKLPELNKYHEQSVVTMKVNGMNDENVNINDSAHCKPCFDQLVEKEMEKLLNYKDAKIYVRKIQNEPDDQQDPEDAEDDSYDSSFQGVTRKRMKNQQGIEANSIQSLPSTGIRGTPRRSSRRRKYRDEREFTVSSLQTLLSLKIEIMHDFKVAPYDQDLFLNEVPLEGNDRTLAELKVVPNSLIYLKVDEPSCSGSSLMEEDYIKDHAPETGFKGTQLQKC